MKFRCILAVLIAATCAEGQVTVNVTTDDGISLATDYYLPGGSGPFPVILERTPYG